ncbi:MAG TPA: D-2-hydroxyacid dehydrogenase [Vicinamibacterales bacterium]
MKILIAIYSQFAMWNIPPSYVGALRREFPEHDFVHALNDDDAQARMADVDVAFMGTFLRSQLAAARRLRWIHSPAAGVGGMLFPEMLASPVVITNSRGMSADTIAEHVLAVTLAMFRRLPHAFQSQAAREWAQDAIGAEGNRLLKGSRILIVGFGAIGSAAGHLMARLGARVTGIKRRIPSQAANDPHIAREGIALAGPDRLLDLLPSADVVVIAAPHTRETRRLIGAEAIAAMAPQAILVNVSRGQLVDEPALAAALAAGRIGGAALDVFNDEPLPPESPFWSLPNVLITPHTSGFRPDHWDAATALFADNLRRFERGEPLVNVVDKRAGY